MEPAPRPAVGEEAPAEPAATAPPPRPRRGGSFLEGVELGWQDAIIFAVLLGSALWAQFGSPINAPLIGPHPVLLAFLRGSVPSMIACGAGARVGHLPLWQALLAPLPILVLADPFLYWAGRRYGRAILDHYAGQSPRSQRRLARAEALFARYGVVAILFSAIPPVSFIAFFLYLAAGESRMPLWRFLLADVVSNLCYIGIVVGIGWNVGQRGVDAANSISRYGLWFSLATLVVVAVVVGRQLRAQGGLGGR